MKSRGSPRMCPPAAAGRGWEPLKLVPTAAGLSRSFSSPFWGTRPLICGGGCQRPVPAAWAHPVPLNQPSQLRPVRHPEHAQQLPSSHLLRIPLGPHSSASSGLSTPNPMAQPVPALGHLPTLPEGGGWEIRFLPLSHQKASGGSSSLHPAGRCLVLAKSLPGRSLPRTPAVLGTRVALGTPSTHTKHPRSRRDLVSGGVWREQLWLEAELLGAGVLWIWEAGTRVLSPQWCHRAQP